MQSVGKRQDLQTYKGAARHLGAQASNCSIVKRLVSMALFGLSVAACTDLPEVGGTPLPKLTSEEKGTFRNLADIPDPPVTTAPDVGDAAIEMLSQERRATENAAEELRAEPFIQPTPPPSVMPF